MTRELIEDFREIILPFLSKRLLKTNYENMGKSDAEEFEKDFNEILDLAIKALEQESTTKNGLGVDAVSRKAVFNQIFYSTDNNGDVVLGSALRERIARLPSVTPQEPRKGHWISHREHCENLGVMPSGLGAYEWCSNCDCGIDVREWHRNHYNYCPNCGAKMESEG